MSIHSTDPSTAGNIAAKPASRKSRWSTRQLVTIALMCALAILLSFIEFPIFPAASFLKLDISLVPAVVLGFTYGTPAGLLCGIACAAAHAIITGNWVGALMNIIVTLVFVTPSALIYSKVKSLKGIIIGCLVGTLLMIFGVSIANLVIDPIFYGMPFEMVSALVLPAIAPFNLIKGVVISVISVIVFKSIKGLLTKEYE